MEHIFLFHVYICIYFMLQVFCFCNGILAVPDVDISLCRRFAVLILTLLPPKSGLDCSFFFNGFGIWSGLFWRAGFVFFSIPTLKSESQPLYGNTVWDRKQRKHKKKQNQTNKMWKKQKQSKGSKFINSFGSSGSSNGIVSPVPPVPPTWESLVESDVPVSWGSTGRKLCGLTRRGKFGN